MATLAEVNALEQRIANANRYIQNVKDPAKKAGATAKLADFQSQLSNALNALYRSSDQDSGPGAAQASQAAPEPEPLPPATGNAAVDQANILSSILNSPLYTESIKSAYLTQYLPGLTQANYEINRANAQEVQNSFLRQQAQAQAIREVAGSFAARGLRTPKMVTEGFAPIQQATELERTAAQQSINDLIANREVMFGAGTTDQESFIKNPTLFGSIGAGARRTALSELMALPEAYGLTQVGQANTSPLGGDRGGSGGGRASLAEDNYRPSGPVMVARPDGTWGPETGASGQTGEQLRARIAAAQRYIAGQQAKGNQRTVAGATAKLRGFEEELRGLKGTY